MSASHLSSVEGRACVSHCAALTIDLFFDRSTLLEGLLCEGVA